MRYILNLSFLLIVFVVNAQKVPKPDDVFGFQPGADYKLANYDMMLDYYTQLAEKSARVVMTEIGKTTLGKPMLLLMISSEENIKNLANIKNIAKQQALATITPENAIQNSIEGKAVIWIDGGLHATEVAGAQMTPELAYKIATDESREVQKIRDNVVLLLMPVMNPDGLDIVADWYYRNLKTPFETSRPPWLYHHYIGHDNNRDWFMNNMPESYHVNDALYREWFPQIVYNHHQTSPAWARIFLPPFSNPVNPRIHPGVTTATNTVGTIMANRFAMEKKPGVISYNNFSMWWNGGMRTVPYYHNMVGILTETAHATPTPRYYDPEKKPKNVGGRRGGMASDGTQIFYPYPWEGGESHFRDAVDYMLTGSMAVLDYAADRKEEFLLNIYNLGRDAIEGNLLGDNYFYHIPVSQPNASEVVNLMNILIRGGIEIQQAQKTYNKNGVEIKEGDYIISTAQAFRPYLEDLMEPQWYPEQRLYPGGPPNPPYDLAGWTLPLQMGVKVSKINNTFNLKTSPINDLILSVNNIDKGNVKGYRLKVTDNASFKAVNYLLNKNASVSRVNKATEGWDSGDFLVEKSEFEKVDFPENIGANFEGIKSLPENNNLSTLTPSKIGIYKSWVSNMDEGWTRFILTDYAFQWDTLHNADILEKNLSEYDVIIFPDQSPERILNGHREGSMPEEFTGGIGIEGVMKLKNYTSSGGKIVTFDGAGDLFIDMFDLPLVNITKGLEPTRFFIPGSLLRANVSGHKYSRGTNEEIAVSFSRSSAYRIIKPSYTGEGGVENTVEKYPAPEVSSIVKYAPNNILMSGWALGEKQTLGNQIGMAEASFGDGSVVLFGFRPQFRAQTRETYRLFFNTLLNEK